MCVHCTVHNVAHNSAQNRPSISGKGAGTAYIHEELRNRIKLISCVIWRATISRSASFFVKFLWTGARTWYLAGTRFNTHRSTRQVPGTFNGRVAISKS